MLSKGGKSRDQAKVFQERWRKEAKQKMENIRSTRNHKESVNMIHQTSLTPEYAYWSEDTTNKHSNTQANKHTGLSLFSSAVCTFLDIIPASAVVLVSTRQTRLVPPWVPLSLNESADAQWKGAGRTHLEIKVKV